MEWTRLLGITRVIFETDCQVVQQAIEGTVQDSTEFGNIIEKGRSMLRGQPHMKVVFVRRSGNTVAHVVARQSIISADLVVGSETPNWLCNTLRDVCNLRH
ncbi:hypothetical protein LINPERPRIM_LOCUS23753 [Linum perenne]